MMMMPLLFDEAGEFGFQFGFVGDCERFSMPAGQDRAISGMSHESLRLPRQRHSSTFGNCQMGHCMGGAFSVDAFQTEKEKV